MKIIVGYIACVIIYTLLFIYTAKVIIDEYKQNYWDELRYKWVRVLLCVFWPLTLSGILISVVFYNGYKAIKDCFFTDY